MIAKRSVTLLFLTLLVMLSMPLASAEWTGQAVVTTQSVHVNFSEDLKVTVTNGQSTPLEVTSVSLTINWEGMPTLYAIFEGSAVLQPGESRTFSSHGTRMPNVQPGTYSCFASVVAKGPDGIAVEHRYPGSIRAEVFDLSFGGIPEEFLVPSVLTTFMLLLTFTMFRFDRVPGWPPFRARPRWGGQRSRRT